MSASSLLALGVMEVRAGLLARASALVDLIRLALARWRGQLKDEKRPTANVGQTRPALPSRTGVSGVYE